MFKGATEPQLAYLGVEQMCVHHGSFDIIQVSVVFQSSLKQTRLLAKLSNMGTVVVGEHLVPQNRICYLTKKNTQTCERANCVLSQAGEAEV